MLSAHIRQCWQEMMLGQFHDCLPGTTIRGVVDDNLEIYSRRTEQANQVLEAAFASVGLTPTPARSGAVIIDPLRLRREELYVSESSPPQYFWLTSDECGNGSLASLPGGLTLPSAFHDAQTGTFVLENARFGITLSETRITSIFDKLNSREVIASGVGTHTAGLMLYEDFPLTYDAWDAEIYHLQMGQEISFDKVEIRGDGLRQSLVASAHFGQSFAEVIVSSIGTLAKTAGTENFRSR